MNQISLNGIRENFYAAVSTAKSYIGNAVRANPNALIATVTVIATAILLRAAVKGYKNYTELKNQVKSQNAEISDLKLVNIIRQEYSDNLKVDFRKDFSKAEENLVNVKKDVEELTKQLEEKNAKINQLEAENDKLDIENLKLLRENVKLLEAQNSAS